MEAICLENGFQTESYTVTTEDDYILSLYRIPGMAAEVPSDKPKPVVLMMHGMDSDMMEWVMNSADKANAFILSRAGYDVWMGNNRGCKYGAYHKTLTTKDRDFWDFYQEDMARKDLPAFVDFVMDKTGVETISYVGHSEGTTQMFLAGALMPEYFTPKINLAIMLAPVARTSNLRGAPAIAAQHIKEIVLTVVDGLHIYNVISPKPAASEGADILCKVPLLTDLCKWVADIVINPDLMNVDRFEAAATMLPSGSGWRNFVYYGQMIVSGQYNLYDYGKKKNKEIYGQEDPMPVPIENYKIPTAMMSGDQDQLAVPLDVEWTVA